MATLFSDPPEASPERRAEVRRGPLFELVPARESRELVTLIYRSAAADASAFAELYDATVSRVYGLALRILRSPAAAEEVAMESYLEVWRTARTFDADRSGAMAWMLAIVLRRVVDRLVDSTPDRTRPRLWPPSNTRALHSAPRPEQVAQIMEALLSLHRGQREVLEWACREDDDTESTHLTHILSTLIDASVWERLPRNDGTTYEGPPGPQAKTFPMSSDLPRSYPPGSNL